MLGLRQHDMKCCISNRVFIETERVTSLTAACEGRKAAEVAETVVQGQPAWCSLCARLSARCGRSLLFMRRRQCSQILHSGNSADGSDASLA